MNKELPEHIYFKQDINKAFNMGMDTAVSLFEMTLGMPHDTQKLLVDKIKNLLMEDKIKTVMTKSEPIIMK